MPDPGSPDDILGEYEASKHRYVDFTNMLHALISSLIEDCKIRLHSIQPRTKSSESLRNKISRFDKRYSTLNEITDLTGIRIITHYEDDIAKISNMIQQEFAVDFENSTDKKAALAPDRFGYISFHYVVSLANNRAILPEYKKCAGLKAEIQVRSILQHAWAEIEHNLGYKSEVEVPRQIRRAFARVAGLLELADQEFVRIRASQVKSQILDEFHNVSIDKWSIRTYLESTELVNFLDGEIAEAVGALRVYDVLDDIVAIGTRACIATGMTTIYELDATLKRLSDRLPSFAKRYAAGLNLVNHAITRGASIFFVSLFSAALSGDEQHVVNLFQRSWDEPGSDFDAKEVAKIAISAAASSLCGESCLRSDRARIYAACEKGERER